MPMDKTIGPVNRPVSTSLFIPEYVIKQLPTVSDLITKIVTKFMLVPLKSRG